MITFVKTMKMCQTIVMAKHYNKRPSEILNIDNDFLAYIFDEVALYLESEAIDDKGKYNWYKIRWESEMKNNKEFIEFLQKYN